MAAKFYKCKTCEEFFYLIRHGEDKCNHKEDFLKEIIPDCTDASQEKHVPVIKQDGTHVTVFVGETEHPMVEEHYIEWIAIETETGLQFKYLKPGGKPHAEFFLTQNEKLIAAYEYCNIHGLWKKEV